MKPKFIFEQERLQPAENSNELLLFTCMLKQESAREILAKFGAPLPARLEFVAHTNPDDPPDISAFGFGFEVTQFPPDQSAILKVIQKQTGRPMIPVPAFHYTEGNYAKIRREIEDLESPTNNPYIFTTRSDLIDALEKRFFRLLNGPDSKDVHGNDILLLDHRWDPNTDRTLEAIKRVTTKKQPIHIKLIIIVGNNESVQAYP